MTPAELYNLKPEKVDNDINNLKGCYFNHMPEIQHEGWKNNFLFFSDNHLKYLLRIEIRYYKDFWFDCRRFWRLASVWFYGEPFMIIQNAGREGDDHAERFVTNEQVYKMAVHYVEKNLPPTEIEEVSDLVAENEEIEGLTEFYGNKLDGHFEIYHD